MSLGSFSRYAIQSIYRNKRRTFAAIIGVLLAVTLVAGENIAIDTTASSVFNEMLESLPYDFVGHAWQRTDILNSTNALASVRNVEHVEIIVGLGGFEITEWGYNGTDNVSYGSVYAIRDSLSEVAEKFGFESDPSVPSGKIVVSDEFAMMMNVNVGDQLTFRFPSPNGTQLEFFFLNMTIGKVVVMSDYDEGTGIVPPGEVLWVEILVNFNDLDAIMSALGIGDLPYYETDFYIWVNRDKLVVPGDPGKTEELLTRMHRELSSVASQYGVSVRPSELTMIVQAFNMWLTMYRAIFLALALPAIVLGVYLGIIGAELGLGERRREIGMLKARGATDRQIFKLLIVEAVILGIIAGVLGIVFGALTSNVFSILTPYGTEQSFLEVTISDFTIVFAVIMAVVLLLISTYRPAKRISALPVTETLHKYSKEEAKVVYKPTRDLIFIGLAIFNYAGLLMLRDFSGEGTSMMAVLCFILPIVIVLTPFAPFFLVIGVTSFLTRFSTKIYDWTSRLSKVITKDLHDIVNRNIVRNPKRASSICVLIAMGLAFGVIVSTMSETQSAHLERTLHAQIGGDISVEAWSVNRSFEAQIEQVDGIDEVASATFIHGNFGYMGSYLGIYAIDSANYWDVVHPEEYFFKEGKPRSAISSLRTYGNIIVNQEFADSEYVRVNDVITVTVVSIYADSNGTSQLDSDEYQFSIIAIVKTLPGFMGTGIGMFREGEIYVDYSSLNRTGFGNQTMIFLVDAESGANTGDVGDEIVHSFPGAVMENQVRVYDVELEEARSDPFAGALFNFLLVEFLFALLIIGVGLGLIMYVAATEREGEFASIMSRGASAKQVTRLLLGEAMTIIIIGVVIGLATGLITSFVFNELMSWGMTSGGQGVLDMPLVVSYMTIGLVLATIAILVVASLIASLRIRRIDLVSALRKRGG